MNEQKKAALFATTFLAPAGQWIIVVGAAMVAAALTINGRIAARNAQKNA